MRIVLVLVALLCTTFFLSSVQSRQYTAKNVCIKEFCRPHEWHAVDKALSHVFKTLVFAIKQNNLDVIEETVLRVSDPDSESYGQYLTLEEVGDIIRNDESLEYVKSYLETHGVAASQMEETDNGEFLIVHTTVEVAEELLDASFYVFESANVASMKVMRTESFSIPDELDEHLDFIGATVQFPNLQSRHIHKGPIIRGYVTPALLNKVYHIDNNVVKSEKSTQSLFESLGQNYSPDDLLKFQKRMNVNQSVIAKVIGPNYDDACERDPNACGEANLDVQYMLAVSTKAPTTFWSMEGDVEPFLDWAVAVSKDKNPPLVHSISYGAIENDPQTFRRFNTEIQKLAARGVTVVVSSGDDGVANFPARSDPEQCSFSPSFPASCPYVVAVGATQGPESSQEEIACSSDTNGIVTSGGGFSTIFKQPSYQKAAVKHFFDTSDKKELPPMDKFHPEGRAYPDVSLLGFNYIIVDDAQFSAESGTSASAPVFAAMISLINGELLAAGKPPVGFVNPLLYKLSSQRGVFNDIKKGRNHCAAGVKPQINCCRYGFAATDGFDPVTGLGSVNFEQLKHHILVHNKVIVDDDSDSTTQDDASEQDLIERLLNDEEIHHKNRRVHIDLDVTFD